MTENPFMLSALLAVLAVVATLVAAGVNQRLTRWPRAAVHSAGPICFGAAVIAAPSFAVVEKMLSRLIFPVGLLWLLGFAVIWWLLLRNRRRVAGVALAIWFVYTLAGNSWIAQGMISWLEADFGPPPAEARFDAVIVLGGGTDVTPWDDPQLSHSGDRLRVGADLHRRGQTALLVCTGSSIPGLSQKNRRNLAAEAAHLWVSMGVPDEAIVQVPGPHNTRAEIAALAELVRERGWQRVGLVTSAWHLRRAMGLAGRHGLDVTAIPADARGRIPPASLVGIVPSGSGFYGVQIAWKEVVGAMLGR